MSTIDNDFVIKNHTDTYGGEIHKSSSFQIKRTFCGDTHEILELKIILDGHTDFYEITNSNKSRRAEYIRRKLLNEIGKICEYGEDVESAERIINCIIESLTSKQGPDTPVKIGKRISSSGASKTESYKFWFDDSPDY